MHPVIIPLVIVKAIAVPVATIAVKKYGASIVGRFLLKSALGASVLAGLGFLTHKGLVITGTYDQFKKNRCGFCTKLIDLEVILSSPIELRDGREAYIVKCINGSCPSTNVFYKDEVKFQ